MYDTLVRWEGKVNHLYLDTKGYVTCGVGFMIPNMEGLREFEWTGGLPDHDWLILKNMKSGQSARYYGLFMRAYMTEVSIQRGVETRLVVLKARLGLLGWPIVEPVIDMAWNLGLRGLDKGFPKLKAACIAGDWQAAALECKRKDVGASRNNWTKDQFICLIK